MYSFADLTSDTKWDDLSRAASEAFESANLSTPAHLDKAESLRKYATNSQKGLRAPARRQSLARGLAIGLLVAAAAGADVSRGLLVAVSEVCLCLCCLDGACCCQLFIVCSSVSERHPAHRGICSRTISAA